MDGALKRGTPVEGPHREVVGAAVKCSELLGEVIQGIKTVAGIEALLILTVTTLHFTVVARCVGANELVPDTQLGGSDLKQRRKVPLAVGEAIGKFKAVIRLDAFHADTSVGIPLEQLLQKIRRGVGGLLRVGGQKAQACELVNGCVLEQAQLRVGDTAAGDHLRIHLRLLSGIGHLLVGLWLVGWLLFRLRIQAQLSHYTEQALRAAGITPLPQTVPQFHHTQVGIAAAHVPNQFQLCLRMLVRVVVRPPGLTGQGRRASIPAGFPKVDVGPALVILPAGTADTVFLRVLHQGVPVCHVLCDTLAHEGYGPLSYSCCLQLQL